MPPSMVPATFALLWDNAMGYRCSLKPPVNRVFSEALVYMGAGRIVVIRRRAFHGRQRMQAMATGRRHIAIKIFRNGSGMTCGIQYSRMGTNFTAKFLEMTLEY